MRKRDRLRLLLQRVASGSLTVELPGLRLAVAGPRRDPLTGLPDRGALQATLAARCVSGPVTILFADLDRFKTVNDRLGHLAGDRVLGVIGTRLARWARGGEVIGRWGGDEWLAILPASAPTEARARAEALCACLRAPIPLGAVTVRATASIGLVAGSGPLDPEVLLAEADRALYAAKARGGDQIATAPLRLICPMA